MVDPVPILVVRTALAMLLAVSVLQKLRYPAVFIAAVREYQLLPARLALPAAAVLIALELVLVVGALAGSSVAVSGIVALLCLYSAAIAINLWRGRTDIDCGCGGASEGRPLSVWLLVRNAALAALGIVALLPAIPRSLGLVDGLSIVAALIVVSSLYAAIDNLARTAPRLRALHRG